MADKTPNGASGRSDLDPFAELTRIMGFDPRLPVEESKPSAAPEADAGAQHGVSGPAAQGFSVEDSISAAELDADDFGIDLEQELLGALSDEDGAAAERADAPPAVAKVPTSDAAELDMQEIEDEIGKHVDAFMEADRAEDVGRPTATEAAPERVETPESIPADDLDEIDIEKSLEEAFAGSHAGTMAEDQQTADDPDWDPAPFLAERPASSVAASPAGDVAAMANVDMDFSGDFAPTDRDNGKTNAADLEAEYNVLLGNISAASPSAQPIEEPPSAQPIEDSTPKSDRAEQRAAAIVAGTWRKPADTQSAAEDEIAERIHDEMAAEAPASGEWDMASDEALATAEMSVDETDDVDPPVDMTAAPDQSEPQAATVAKPESTPEDPFAALAAMAAKYQSGPQESTWRDTASRYETPRPAVQEPAQPAHARPLAPAMAQRPAAPEIETVDVQDHAVALADDLNLPDVAYDEPQARRYDDLDAEFNNLLNEMSSGERREPAPAAYAPIQRQPAYVEQRSAPQPQRPVQAAAPTPVRYEEDPYDAVSDSDFEEAMAAFEADADDDQPLGAPMASMAERRPRRGLYIAAIVGGLALIGGIGAVAMSFGGINDAGEIALVKADGKPFKVRPATPGGTTMPDRDSTVYDTVSRAGSSTEAPTQEQLVNTAEEPLDLPVPNDEETIDDVASIAKGEDRVEQVDEPDTLASQETIAVAPRKVRTMVVKSDGTLVPREEPVPEAANENTPTPAAAPPLAASEEEPGTEQITTGATKPNETPAEADEVAALPEQPEKPVAPAAGSWSVQVSSQPSEDGANKSLKSISRKYAGVIGDRGGNVVKAEVDGKGTMWRVRIPAGSRDDAISLCGDLKAAGGSCFVTK